MQQYLNANYIPNKNCANGQTWGVCNKAALMLKDALLVHAENLMNTETP